MFFRSHFLFFRSQFLTPRATLASSAAPRRGAGSHLPECHNGVFEVQPFQWGTFAEFLESTRFGHRGADVAYGPHDTHLGRLDLVAHGGGAGTLEYLYGDSLRVVIFNCRFGERQVFNVMDAGWLRFNFGLNLAVDMSFGEAMRVQVAKPSWRFISLPECETAVEVVPPGAQLQWVTVCFRPELLSELTGTGKLPGGMLSDESENCAPVHRGFKLTPLLQNAAAAILGVRPTGQLRAPYVATKARELLVLGLDHMLGLQHAEAPQVRLSARDIRALNAARAILEASLAQAPTVQALSRKVGMNRTKLFYGFKQVFGLNISQLLRDLRIEEGYRLLTTTDTPLSEIAARVGFRHLCNFSTAFRTRYGCAPSALRNSVAGRVS